MNGKDFIAKLKRLNPRIRFFEGRGHIAGLYLYMPKHPMANPETGLKHLGGMPSPRFFGRLPKEAFWDDTLGGFNKGWATVVRELSRWRMAGRPVISRLEAQRVFGNLVSFKEMPKPIKKTWAGKERMKEKYQLHSYADYDKVMEDQRQTTDLGMKLRAA
jgi:hypothetical protein